MFLQLAHTKLDAFNVSQDLGIECDKRGSVVEMNAAIGIAYKLTYVTGITPASPRVHYKNVQIVVWYD
jgi:hypothetical protein